MSGAEPIASGIDHLVASIPHVILLVHDGPVVFANVPASALLGVGTEQLRAGYRSGLRDEASRDAFDALLKRAADDGGGHGYLDVPWPAGSLRRPHAARHGLAEEHPPG